MARGERQRAHNRYEALIENLFLDRYKRGVRRIEFTRNDLEGTARDLSIKLPKNPPDAIYTFRYRQPMPERVQAKAPRGMEWIIVGAGKSRYHFRLVSFSRIEPNPTLAITKIPDATPEVISKYALSDEQALLAKVRYNRLVDIFLGMATYSLQSHLRTSVGTIGQIEIDEIYVGVDRRGTHFIIPVQAKGGTDRLSVVQSMQDLAYCAEKFPSLICRALSTQFMSHNEIAIFELGESDDEIRIFDERHYKLVPGNQISTADLVGYARL